MELSILHISDTHNKHKIIPKDWLVPADVIVHSGDISGRGYFAEIEDFLNWYSKLTQYTYKILIAGNHDFGFQDNPNKVRELLEKFPNIIYLQDSGVEILGVNFWGSPWQPTFFNWAFNLDRGLPLKEKWDLIPSNTDVLITHGPAKGYGDKVINRYSPSGGENVGCEDLLQTILEIKPKLFCCGHIHQAQGVEQNEHTTFSNGAILNEDYLVAYKPNLFKIPCP